MARKRLNKKVVLIGSLLFVVVVGLLILAMLRLSQKPQKFIEYGDTAVKAAREATDEDVKTEEYERAERNYHKARSLAKTDSLKVKVLFKLAEMYMETEQWPKVLGSWKMIVRLDPENVKARFGQLKYFYMMADSGAQGTWQEVASQASELIEVAEEADLLMKDAAECDPFEREKRGPGEGRLGSYLYLLRGRANSEMARIGIFPDRDELLARAIDDLKRVQDLESGNVDAYWYLAQATLTKGEIDASRGELEERDRAGDEAVKTLERAVEVAGDNPRAHANLLTMKLRLARKSGGLLSKEQIEGLEPEYLSLVEKFPSSAEVFSALAGFYRFRPENLAKAVDAAEKAVELDRQNVIYVINAASLHYRRFSAYGERPELNKAIEEAKYALTLPDAQDKPGPRQWTGLRNRVLLYEFLARCYLEQVIYPLEGLTEAQKHELLAEAEQAVHEIEQLFGVGEAPQVVKWRGMLELAKGDRNSAVRKLYSAYEQLKAAKPSQPPFPADPGYAELCYTLAKVFEDTSETGAVAEFLAHALYSGIVENKPEAILDYAKVLLRLRRWPDAISNIDAFERNFWTNERSRSLRITGLIGANQLDDADKELAKSTPNDAGTVRLKLTLVRAKIRQVQRAFAQKQMREGLPVDFERGEPQEEQAIEPEGSVGFMTAELKSYRADMAKLVEKLLVIEPNSVGDTVVIDICNSYVGEGNTYEAKALVNRFLEHFPDNTRVLFYKQMLEEPEPKKISEERRREIEEHVMSNIANPVQRAVSLGRLHYSYGEFERAAAEFRKVIETDESGPGAGEKPTEGITDSRQLAAAYLFEIALASKDWETASEVAGVARGENLDNCDGQFFAARFAMAKGEYRDALSSVEECLKRRPVFSSGFLLRSKIHAALGNELSSMEDVQKAASLNPQDGAIAKALAFVLYRRNRELGDNVTFDQLIETKRALLRAIGLNPRDLQLRSFYAEYIRSTEPSNALAIRQQLQRVSPSVENALLLGRQAMTMAVDETNAAKKGVLFDIAASALEEAKALDPQNRAVLEVQAEYYRLTGQADRAQEMLVEAQDPRLLWNHYFRLGRFEDAKRVLEELHKSPEKDSSVVRGLLLVAERTADTEAVKKYTEELLLLDNSIANNLIQIQTFLRTGLIKEAEHKLQSFREKYPDEPGALLLEGWLAMRRGQLTRALELTNRNLEANQGNAVAWRLRGEINLLKGNYAQAVDDLKTSKSLFSEPVTRFALAKAYLGAGREEDAITELKNMINNPQTQVEGDLIRRGPRQLLERIYLQSGRKETLRRFYEETVKEFPDASWYNRAGAFALAEGEFGRAEQYYKQALEKSTGRDGDRAAALDGYLQALLSGAGTPNLPRGSWEPRKLDKVFEEGRKHVDSDLAPVAYLRMADAKLKLGDEKAAIQYCQRGLAKAFAGSDEVFASQILQRMYSLLGAEGVLEYCMGRLETEPDSVAANLAMFNLMKMSGDYNEALRYIDRCLELIGPADPRRFGYVIRKVSVLDLAYNRTSDNDYLRRIIAEFESLLTKMPNNTIVLNNLAYVLAKNNERLAEALEYAERACKVQPNNPGFLDTYGYVLYKNGRNERAEEYLQAAVQQYEQSNITVPAEVYEHLGLVKEGLGAKTEALNAYKKALEVGADTLPEVSKKAIESAIERLSQSDSTGMQMPKRFNLE